MLVKISKSVSYRCFLYIVYSASKNTPVSVANSTPATIGAGPAVYSQEDGKRNGKQPTAGKVCADVYADVCAAINMAGFLSDEQNIHASATTQTEL